MLIGEGNKVETGFKEGINTVDKKTSLAVPKGVHLKDGVEERALATDETAQPKIREVGENLNPHMHFNDKVTFKQSSIEGQSLPPKINEYVNPELQKINSAGIQKPEEIQVNKESPPLKIDLNKELKSLISLDSKLEGGSSNAALAKLTFKETDAVINICIDFAKKINPNSTAFTKPESLKKFNEITAKSVKQVTELNSAAKKRREIVSIQLFKKNINEKEADIALKVIETNLAIQNKEHKDSILKEISILNQEIKTTSQKLIKMIIKELGSDLDIKQVPQQVITKYSIPAIKEMLGRNPEGKLNTIPKTVSSDTWKTLYNDFNGKLLAKGLDTADAGYIDPMFDFMADLQKIEKKFEGPSVDKQEIAKDYEKLKVLYFLGSDPKLNLSPTDDNYSKCKKMLTKETAEILDGEGSISEKKGQINALNCNLLFQAGITSVNIQKEHFENLKTTDDWKAGEK